MNERFSTTTDTDISPLLEQKRVGDMMRNIGGWAVAGISRVERVEGGHLWAEAGEDAYTACYVSAEGRASPVITIPKVTLDVLA